MAPSANTVPAFRKPAIAIVPDRSEILPAETVPATDRLPVFASEKSPFVTPNLCSVPIALPVPASETVPVADPELRSVPAIIVPLATWVMPPPAAERSTVVPDSTCKAFSAKPPAPAASVNPLVAVTEPVTDNGLLLPSENPSAVKFPTVPILAPASVSDPVLPVNVAAVKTLPAVLTMAPPLCVIRSRFVVADPKFPPDTAIVPAVAVRPDPGTVTAPSRTRELPIPVSDAKLPPEPPSAIVAPAVFGANSVVTAETEPPAAIANVSACNPTTPAVTDPPEAIATPLLRKNTLPLAAKVPATVREDPLPS